jgi:spore coat polysaccharide biosynthesis protein SpsF (cytidylyltransferase family)
MRVGIVINARCGSTRLPDKHFADINGKPALRWLINRLPKKNLFIATGKREDNERFEFFGIPVFYGDPHNIPLRHYQLGEKYMLDAIVSIDGDDLLTSPKAVEDVIQYLEHYDIVRTEGLPLGMNVLWAYKMPALKHVLDTGINKHITNDTGWGWIFEEMKVTRIEYEKHHEMLSLTMDTPEDLALFRRILGVLPKDCTFNDRKLCEWIIANA